MFERYQPIGIVAFALPWLAADVCSHLVQSCHARSYIFTVGIKSPASPSYPAAPVFPRLRVLTVMQDFSVSTLNPISPYISLYGPYVPLRYHSSVIPPINQDSPGDRSCASVEAQRGDTSGPGLVWFSQNYGSL